MAEPERRSLLRNHHGGHAQVSYLELFFDLVFVFAITQLSHFIHDHFGWLGLVQGLALFLAVWWAWIFTTWVTNWADPERIPVRVMLLVLMLVSLVMAVALPRAFADGGLVFAAAYVLLQVGRSAGMTAIFAAEPGGDPRNMARATIWFAVSAVFWIAGGLADPHGAQGLRLALWAAALAIEYAGPFAYFRVPGLGRSTLRDWDISGSHMAERCALFIIIALGEGIIVTGTNFAAGAGDIAGGTTGEIGLIAAFALAFAGSVLMWWLYFDLGAQRGASHIEHHAEAGRVARNAYTYLHMPIVAGVVVSAVADALLLEHWHEPASRALVVTSCGSLLAYVGGLALFKRVSSSRGNLPLSHQTGFALLVLLGIAGWVAPIPALSFYGLGVIVLMVIALWEWGSFHGGWAERWQRLRTGRADAEP